MHCSRLNDSPGGSTAKPGEHATLKEALAPLLISPNTTGKLSQVLGAAFGRAVSAGRIQDMLRYGVVNADTLARNLSSLHLLLQGENIALAFHALSMAQQVQTYRAAQMLGVEGNLVARGVDTRAFSYTLEPLKPISSRDIHELYFSGYPVEVGDTWSRIKAEDYKEILTSKRFHLGVVPRRGARVLSLCGGYGEPLKRVSGLFEGSELVLVDSCFKNILNATSHLVGMGRNSVQLRLCDVREGFDGIPFDDSYFHFIFMVGNSEHGMSMDDITRVMNEIMRTLIPGTGRFLAESNNLERYESAMRKSRYIDNDLAVSQIGPFVMTAWRGK